MKTTLIFIASLWVTFLTAQPANDDCANAISLTIDDPITCGETTSGASLEAAECYANYAGNTETTSWYRFTADNDSLVINFVQTNNSDCFATMNIFGPFAPGTGCGTGCATNIYSQYLSGDPGQHILLVGWSAGLDYLIQVQNNNCGGPAANFLNFCIGVANPSKNSVSTGASLIDECGTSFSETTDGGYWNSGTGTGFANLDDNAGTQCGICAAGLDVPFVINNAAWNTFCSLTDGTWQVTVDNVTNCALTGAGVQASLFTGTTAALVNEDYSSPVAPTGWTSSTITVNSGDCAFLMIDGFAGDICDYDVTLSNLTGGCDVLPVELLSFDGQTFENRVELQWEVATASDIKKYVIEKSTDGENFGWIGEITEIEDHIHAKTYTYTDLGKLRQDTYYQLKSIETDGTEELLAVKYFKRNTLEEEVDILVYPNPAKESITIDFDHKGAEELMLINIYNLDGSVAFSREVSITLSQNKVNINLEGLVNGQYIIEIIGDQTHKTSPLLIAR